MSARLYPRPSFVSPGQPKEPGIIPISFDSQILPTAEGDIGIQNTEPPSSDEISGSSSWPHGNGD